MTGEIDPVLLLQGRKNYNNSNTRVEHYEQGY
jgi:hypothetical protein